MKVASCDVAVVTFFGTEIFDEIAQMLVAAFADCGATATFASDASRIAACRPNLVVLFGQGPEFGDLEWLRFAHDGRRRPNAIFWGFDPLPPPGLSSDVVERQLEVARLRERMRAHPSGPQMLGRVPRRLKALARRIAAGRSPLTDEDTWSDVPAFDARAFYRLQWIKGHMERGRLQAVAGTNRAFVATLREQGIDADQEPVGYSPMMGRDEGRDRDIDVLFLASTNSDRPGRREALEVLRSDLRSGGMELYVPSEQVFGAARSALLNRTKAIVNLRSNSWHPELMRFVLAAACGVAIVTDQPATYTEPFIEGTHYLAAERSGLAELLQRVARDDDLRARIARNANELVTRDMTMVQTAQRMLDRFA